MAWTVNTYNSLNGYCGNCSIVLSSKVHIMTENKNVITWSLVVLFLSLSIVYSLTYQKKEALFKSSARSRVEAIKQIWNQNEWSSSQKPINLNKDSDTAKDTKKSDSVSLWDKSSWVSNSNTQTPSTNESSTSLRLASTKGKMLPGTSEYIGTLDIVSILGEKPEFTLQDSRWNYFAYYGSHLNFVQTIKTLGGNIYEMVTESEILQNQLFGDRVSYINLSMFKDIRVLMVIEIDGDVWLLQIPADQYHQSKDYLKSLFIK